MCHPSIIIQHFWVNTRITQQESEPVRLARTTREMEGSFSTIVLLVNVKALPRQQHPKNFYRAGVDIIRRVHSANFVKNCSSAFVSTAKIKRGVLEQKMGHLKRGPILDDKGK